MRAVYTQINTKGQFACRVLYMTKRESATKSQIRAAAAERSAAAEITKPGPFSKVLVRRVRRI
jgi:hypothetical protein